MKLVAMGMAAAIATAGMIGSAQAKELKLPRQIACQEYGSWVYNAVGMKSKDLPKQAFDRWAKDAAARRSNGLSTREKLSLEDALADVAEAAFKGSIKPPAGKSHQEYATEQCQKGQSAVPG